MRIPRIYTAQCLTEGQNLVLEAGPAAHVSRVLRMRAGQSLLLFNGDGNEYLATITEADKRCVQISLGAVQTDDRESSLPIELGIGISRGDRMDWVLQKATELGVTAITPVLSERTGVKLKGERADKKWQHWQQVVISACEQCGRNRLPTVAAPCSLDHWLSKCEAERRYVLHHRASTARNSAKPASVALAIGPEGGLSEAEIKACQVAGFEALSLGPRILRTETAPLAAIAILQSHWGDMGLPST
ncbi:MAG: 16S rRNA (uracil(1498)-N(3))-methyltransferase [Parahaliea sp.]